MMKRSRTAKVLSIVFLVTVFSFFSEPVLADFEGNPWPEHDVSSISCDSLLGIGTIHAYPPSFVRSWGGANELVIWNPTLYRLVGNQWVKYTETVLPAYALATPSGISGGWFNLYTHQAWTVSSFFDVTTGTYTVKNEIFWHSTFQTHGEWAPNSCTVY